jgi:hypothetical protein
MASVTLTAHAFERIGRTLIETDDGNEMGGPLAGSCAAGESSSRTP